MAFGRQECDIAKTGKIYEHLNVPKNNRDANWKKQFLVDVKTASFRCGNPQVFIGPDKFPYFALHLPEENKAFESFCIMNLKDDYLLKDGIGIAINPTENSVDFVFSYGDIVNLHINDEFFSETDSVEIKNEEILSKSEKVLIAQPSEKFLPNATRNILKKYLQGIGIETPKLMLVHRTIENQIIPELAFNIYVEDYENKNQLNYYMQQLSWYLPKHYVILSVPKDSDLNKGFMEI